MHINCWHLGCSFGSQQLYYNISDEIEYRTLDKRTTRKPLKAQRVGVVTGRGSEASRVTVGAWSASPRTATRRTQVIRRGLLWPEWPEADRTRGRWGGATRPAKEDRDHGEQSRRFHGGTTRWIPGKEDWEANDNFMVMKSTLWSLRYSLKYFAKIFEPHATSTADEPIVQHPSKWDTDIHGDSMYRDVVTRKGQKQRAKRLVLHKIRRECCVKLIK